MNDLSAAVKQAYEEQYDASIVVWRALNGKHKAQRVVEILQNIPERPQKVCEVGCGEGSILQYLGAHGNFEQLYGLEISESAIHLAKEKQINNLVEIKKFDGYEIPYPDNYFDLVVCSHVVEHVEHPRLLLREIKRVSRLQYWEVPIDFSLTVDKKIAHFLAYGHINVFTPALFRFLLQSEKFGIIDDVTVFYSDDILRFHHRDNRWGYWKKKIKNQVVKSVTLLRNLKPDAYGVLTTGIEGALAIFAKQQD